jgi:hypothetical protein
LIYYSFNHLSSPPPPPPTINCLLRLHIRHHCCYCLWWFLSYYGCNIYLIEYPCW